MIAAVGVAASLNMCGDDLSVSGEPRGRVSASQFVYRRNARCLRFIAQILFWVN
jgi:hypothetical protein